ncbi:hemolysin family protein [Sanguibacter sp. HDW7]|uniref:hemolysin family protein n=1 Tax=Sanguibacter sp. HDW7 TaxID=2714931 RepID=UPI00140DA448|nr:hemolysin family protein [Sanguibacter sp. HDW7]QIK83809.1 HlyC/CorC family transporter [Sanguibacter sp. HDW7]
MTGLLITLAVAGIVLAALLSAGETAVLRVTRASVAQIVADGGARARRIERLADDPRRTASAASFLRILGEMVATACITLSLEEALDVWWQVLGLAVVISTLVALVLVRLSPRSFGRHHPAKVLSALSGLLTVARTLAGWAAGADRQVEATEEHTEHELRDMVDRVNESEVIEAEERELIRSVFGLGSTLTREVMVPRTDMVTTRASTPLRSALQLFLRSGFSRVPVVGDSEDDVLGVVYFKDVVARLQVEGAEDGGTVVDVMRPPHFVPESKPADDLLRDLQAARSHMALVIDEYGGTAGLVTIEDAIEEIVGELTDEHDQAVVEAVEVAPGQFRLPARTSLWDLSELLGTVVEDDDVDTVAGLLAKALGRVPLLGSSADVAGLHLVAEKVEGRRKRVSSILVSHLEPAADDVDDRTTISDRRTDA